MSYPVFHVPAGDVLPVMFASYDGATGASEAISGLAVTDIEIYKDGSVTQRASDAGYTLLDTDGIDFDGIAGINGFSINTGDNTDSGFYTVGAWFTVVVSAITADTQTVNFIACQFRLMPAEDAAGVPDVNATHIGGTAQSGVDIAARIGAPAGASIAADIAAIEAQTDDIGVAGAGLTAVPWNSAWDAEVQSEVQDAIEANHLDHLLAVTYDPASKPGAADALLNELVENDGGVARYSANALEQAPTGAGGDGSAFTAIPWNAAWDAEVQSEVTDALNAYDPPTRTEATADKDEVIALIGTPTDLGGGATLADNLADIEAQTDDIGTAGAGLTAVPWNASWDAEVQSEVADALAAYDPPTRAEATSDKGEILTVLGTPTDTDIATDIAAVQTTADAILVDTGTTLQAELDGIQADTEDIQSRLPAALVGGRMSSDAVAISGDTGAADRLEAVMDGVIVGQVNDAAATTTAFAADGFTEATDDHFNGRLITFISGALSGQQTDITDYDAAGGAQGDQQFTVTALTEAPADGDSFIIH